MHSSRITVALLFGGPSAEHDISIRSLKGVLSNLNVDRYHPIAIHIDREGSWWLMNASDIADNGAIREEKGERKRVVLVPQGRALHVLDHSEGPIPIDVVFPILHGPYGEDGTVQGVLRAAGCPFVGSGVLGSAVGMDKDVMKRLLRDAGIRVSPFKTLRRYEDIPSFEQMVALFGHPLYVKPANMGSSIGVSRVTHSADYDAAVQHAFSFDSKVIIEQAIQGREIECAVLDGRPPRASIPGEIVLAPHSTYSYDAKYVLDDAVRLEVPAQLDRSIQESIQELAIRTFQLLECRGFARIDFFLDSKYQLVVNEINTIPGFTPISMFPKMWKVSGISYEALIDELIEFALDSSRY